ncbi:MAG: hypothetical protein HY340_03100 [Candidatus Kerfeldbacteria bacterium]|nr:hypothetical protein [Candidatus Kerfeldbacteria bacterium]
MTTPEEPPAPDNDPAGIAVQPITNFCTSTQGSVVPPFGWKEYAKQQQGTSDVYGVTVDGALCQIGTGGQGELDARVCCDVFGFRYVSNATAQIAAYAPLVGLFLVFLAIGAYQKWRRDVVRTLIDKKNRTG